MIDSEEREAARVLIDEMPDWITDVQEKVAAKHTDGDWVGVLDEARFVLDKFSHGDSVDKLSTDEAKAFRSLLRLVGTISGQLEDVVIEDYVRS